MQFLTFIIHRLQTFSPFHAIHIPEYLHNQIYLYSKLIFFPIILICFESRFLFCHIRTSISLFIFSTVPITILLVIPILSYLSQVKTGTNINYSLLKSYLHVFPTFFKFSSKYNHVLQYECLINIPPTITEKTVP